MSYILGLSALYHDSAAALIKDGEIIAAAQEERFTRIKHDPRFPSRAINYAFNEAKIDLADIEAVVFYDKPLLKFERLLETYLATAPRGLNSFRMAMPVWLREKLFLKDLIHKELTKLDSSFSADRLKFTEHHFSHAASAFYPSPFEKAVVLTLDGVGEWATTSVAIGEGSDLDIVKELHFPHSLGLLYSAFTYYTGFKVNSGEYKLMGLAPYGQPIYRDKIRDNLIDIKPDGSFRLDQTYFNYTAGLTMTSKRFSELFENPVRDAEKEPLTQFHMDIAASIQAVTEDIVLKLTRDLAATHSSQNLCLAGGVALNCVANGKILKDGAFKNIWIQPAAGDAGGALGSALGYWHHEKKNPRKIQSRDAMQGSYLGPSYQSTDIEKELNAAGAIYTKLDRAELYATTAKELADGKATGWFQGRMEFGPRALGRRSIIGDPRSESMQKTLNLKVKFRESFRPFAPAVLSEDVADWFELDEASPYMLMVAGINKRLRREMTAEESTLFGIEKLNIKRSDIPAVTHIDYSARIQTVHRETNAEFHALLTEFKNITGCSVLVNTSFNVRGEPIVCTPTDAFKCFMGTDMEVLVIENYLLHKSDQDPALLEDYKNKYELD